MAATNGWWGIAATAPHMSILSTHDVPRQVWGGNDRSVAVFGKENNCCYAWVFIRC